MIHRLDKYQIKGIEAVSNSDVSIITGNKSSGKSFFLRYLLNKRWGRRGLQSRHNKPAANTPSTFQVSSAADRAPCQNIFIHELIVLVSYTLGR